MKIDLTAKMIWLMLGKECAKSLERQGCTKDPEKLKKQIKQNYYAILKGYPSIGGSKNPMSSILYMAALVFAVHLLDKNTYNRGIIKAMLNDMMDCPLLIKFAGKDNFNKKYAKQCIRFGTISRKLKRSGDWQFEYIPGKDYNEYRINQYACGICALGKHLDCSEIVPELCYMDYAMAEYAGAELVRTGTLAQGAPFCDFHYRKKTDCQRLTNKITTT